MHRQFTWALLVTLLGILPAGCGRGRMGDDGQSAAVDAESALRDRAETLWNAKVAEDCKTVYLFESSRGEEGVSEDSYCDYFNNEEPFKVHSCKVGDVIVEGDMGWVQLDVTTSMRRFPAANPVEAHRWEKWYYTDDPVDGGKHWIPVPPKELDAYPDSPAVRDREAEAELRARFEESWNARVNRDWTRLYDFIDPRDRATVDEQKFADTHAMFQYISCNVHWVEAEGDLGTVRVTVHHKLNDPSLTKLPPRDVTVREEWVRYEGTWYLDVKRAES
ncbi:MAG TPA: hypothetical protein P5572_06190 [Phycisphaerae bacterium]|nr:hypothetical protein [Phycisphaerae bacterium]